MNKERQPPFANAMLYANEMTRRVAYNTHICATLHNKLKAMQLHELKLDSTH